MNVSFYLDKIFFLEASYYTNLKVVSFWVGPDILVAVHNGVGYILNWYAYSRQTFSGLTLLV